MLVIRVESIKKPEDGRWVWMRYSDCVHDDHWYELPAPTITNPEEVCGCVTFHQFKKWWPMYSELPLNRARIVILDVEKVTRHKYQVTFNRREAKIVGKVTRKGLQWQGTLKHSTNKSKEKFSRYL